MKFYRVKLFSRISNLCGPDPPMLQTDIQMDRRTDNMQSQYRTMHYSAPHGKNCIIVCKLNNKV